MPSKKSEKKEDKKEKKVKKEASEDKKSKKTSTKPAVKKESKPEKKALKPKSKIAKPKKQKKSPTKKEDKSATSKSHVAKVKVTSGTIARAAKTRIDNLAHMIYTRAKTILPNVEVSKRCVYTAATMLDQVVQNLVDQTLDVYSTQGRKTINVNDAFVAVQAALPQTLANAAVATAAGLISERHGTKDAVSKVIEALGAAEFKPHYQ